MIKRGFIIVLLLLCVFSLSAQIAIENPLIVSKELTLFSANDVEPERAKFDQLILENPNYFGNLSKSIYKIVKFINFNTAYEQLSDLGYYPEKSLAEAFVQIKRPYGYMSALCGNGSFEYVRFYADWNGDGDYFDAGEDLGLGNVNVHDIPNIIPPYPSTMKPLTYTVTKRVYPPRYSCPDPYLVRMRAVLAWQQIPPAGNPNFIPVWGNRVDRWVQIQPAKKLFYFQKLYPKIPYEILKENIDILDDPEEKEELPLYELEKMYAEYKVSSFRYSYKEFAEKLNSIEKEDEAVLKKIAYEYKFDYSLLYQYSNTSYEQLRSVGLEYDTDKLTASFTIKQPYGYNGKLCYTKGSYEYIGFWLYIYNNNLGIFQWVYMGTAKVNVHDISPLPGGGLEYAVAMPADLDSLKDICTNPKVYRIRAILSWNNPHPANQPNTLPYWGNRVDSFIQLKPGQPVPPDLDTPFISMAGKMPVSSITGNAYSTVTSPLGDGYADGVHYLNGTVVNDAPFGGQVQISGYIPNPPDDPTELQKFRYKAQYRKVGNASWTDMTNKFLLTIDTYNDNTNNWTQDLYWQEVDSDGYYKYQVDEDDPIKRYVGDNKLAVWRSRVPDGDGLYEIRIAVKHPIFNTHTYSNVVRLKIDNTKPTALIHLNNLDCSKFYKGSIIDAYITAADLHIKSYRVKTKPYSMPIYYLAVEISGDYLLTSNFINRNIKLYTTTVPSCGYIAQIEVWDRTIVNNTTHGNKSYDDVGFCLLD